MYQLAIFDLDGTLLDTLAALPFAPMPLLEALLETAEKKGEPAKSSPENNPFPRPQTRYGALGRRALCA